MEEHWNSVERGKRSDSVQTVTPLNLSHLNTGNNAIIVISSPSHFDDLPVEKNPLLSTFTLTGLSFCRQFTFSDSAVNSFSLLSGSRCANSTSLADTWEFTVFLRLYRGSLRVKENNIAAQYFILTEDTPSCASHFPMKPVYMFLNYLKKIKNTWCKWEVACFFFISEKKFVPPRREGAGGRGGRRGSLR